MGIIVRVSPSNRGLPGLAGLVLVVLMALTSPSGAVDVAVEPILRIEAGMHTGVIRGITADRSGRWAATVSDDNTARLWDAVSGALIQIYRPPLSGDRTEFLWTIALDPSSATVAVGGRSRFGAAGGVAYLFDRSTGRMLRRLHAGNKSVDSLAFSPDGRWLATCGGSPTGLQIWDWRTTGIPFKDTVYGDYCLGLDWASPTVLATTSYDRKIRVYRVDDQGLVKLAEAVAPGGDRPFGISYSRDAKLIAVGYSDAQRVDVLDAESLQLLHSPKIESGNRAVQVVAFSKRDDSLYAGGTWHVNRRTLVRVWQDSGLGPSIDIGSSARGIFALHALPNGQLFVAAGTPEWGLIDDSRQWNVRGPSPITELSTAPLRLSVDGTEVQFGNESDGQRPSHMSIANRNLTQGSSTALRKPIEFGLDIRNWRNEANPTLNGQPLTLRNLERSYSLAIAHDNSSFVLGTNFDLKCFDSAGKLLWRRASAGTVWSVNIPSSGKHVVAASADGTIRWYRIKDGVELLAFFPHSDGSRWVLWTPAGYYDVSAGGEGLIGWQVNRSADTAADFFEASRFRERFYRPDIIDRVLASGDVADAVSQADAARGAGRAPVAAVAAVAIAHALPPVIDLESSGEVSADRPSVSIRYRVRTGKDAPLTNIQVRIDGQRDPTSRPAPSQSDADVRELAVPVPSKNVTIQIFAENRYGSSAPANVRVKWTGQNPPISDARTTEIKPKLYVLAIGVGNYGTKQINPLLFAAKDARDFAQTMLAQKGPLYRDVEVRLLTDSQVTRDTVVSGLSWLQRQVTQHDIGMLFMAGHGVNDTDGSYYFLPSTADPDELAVTGVSTNDIRRTLTNLAGKSVFFIDTCHAGNALGPGRRAVNDITRTINELASAENGVVVFSSASGRQYALEDPSWGNGAFTKAVVDGLSGQAAQAGSSRVTYKMLDLFVSENVKRLTGGRQSPVTQAPGGVPDFTLSLARERN